MGRFNVGLFSAGCKETLLCLYEQLSYYENRGDFRHAPVVFIADRDMWLFRGIPVQYDDIIWTEGYSIENDLYSHAKLRRRIGRNSEYEQVLDSICAWFAYKVEEYLAKNPPPPRKIFQSVRDEEHVHINFHCNRIIPDGQTELASGLESLPSGHQRVKEVRDNYHLQLRGKTLFELLVRFLSRPKHGFKKASVNAYALYNDAITVPESNQLFSRVAKEVQEKLHEQNQKIATQQSLPDISQ
ncbi:hypothetical protein F4X88_10290 [Candidatus Poribacteria bacterium]|nr:hypothetical protein [Candidatus Poribacteria bacterium]